MTKVKIQMTRPRNPNDKIQMSNEEATLQEEVSQLRAEVEQLKWVLQAAPETNRLAHGG